MRLKAGTTLFHGTSADFDESSSDLEGPAWLSSSQSVANHFAQRFGSGPSVARIVAYRLTDDIELPEICSSREMQEFAEEHDIDLCGVHSMRESMQDSGQPGWVIPFNYPDGNDILIVNTGILEYVETILVA